MLSALLMGFTLDFDQRLMQIMSTLGIVCAWLENLDDLDHSLCAVLLLAWCSKGSDPTYLLANEA